MTSRFGELTVILVAAALMTSCAGDADPHVTFIAPAGQNVTVHGCPDCGDGVEAEPLRDLRWTEHRSLPRTYEVTVNGRRVSCPPLTDEYVNPEDSADHPSALFGVVAAKCVSMPIK